MRRNQVPLQRRLQGGDLAPFQTNEPGAGQIQLVWAGRGQQRPHWAGRPLGGAVALHGNYGVCKAENRVEVFIQIHNHPGEIPGIREAEVVFRFQGARNRAEEILGSGGHTHHAVTFELAEVDDGVSLCQVLGVLKGAGGQGLGICGLRLGKVPVQLCPGGLHRIKSSCPIDFLHKGGGI